MVGGPLWTFISAICWLMALIFGYVSLMQLKAHAEDGRTPCKTPVFTFLAGVLMAGSPTFLQNVLASFYGEWNTGVLSYVVPADHNKTFIAVLAVVAFIGYCFFVRGIWVLKEAGEPQRNPASTVGKAIVIMTAGMFAIYIDITLKMLATTFGWDISMYIGG